MTQGPCLNPNCHSHGQPHPNCRCYSFAEGGPVDGHFCASGKPHDPSCEYYAAGGDVSPQGQEEIDPEASSAAALAHGGANMLFGSPKSTYFGAFGSGRGLGDNRAQYLSKVKKGSKTIETGVGSLFDSSIGHNKAEHTEKDLNQLKDYIKEGGSLRELESQASEPKEEDPLSSQFPKQNVTLNTAKSRISEYLNSLRPSDVQTKLPFDANPSTRVQEKEYEKALKLAAKPLSILDHIKKGNITPTNLKHFASMYPELHDHLSKKMTEQVIKAQLEGKRPPYGTRQGMSLFLGAALDSTLTPQSIQAAQRVFANKAQAQQQTQAQGKTKKGTAPLSKVAKQYETDDQASESRKRQ